MLEKMGEFFEARLNGYEEHQLTCIDSAREFYPFTAACLPQTAGPDILDLGCGTGLELGYFFETVPTFWTWAAERVWSSGFILKPFPRQGSPVSTFRRGCSGSFAESFPTGR